MSSRATKQSIRSEFSSIRDQAVELIEELSEMADEIHEARTRAGSYWESDHSYKSLIHLQNNLADEALGLLRAYQSKIPSTEQETGLKLDQLVKFENVKSGLRRLLVECEKVLGSLELQDSTLSETEVDRLNNLTRDLAKVCEPLEDKFEKNMILAIESAGKGDALASALISGRVVDYIFSQWKSAFGTDQAEVIVQKLGEKGLIDSKNTDARQTIIKASKKARNFFSHNIDALADNSDALSFARRHS
jgi:hypothetical protein